MKILAMSTHSTDVNQMLHDAAAYNLLPQPVLSTFVCKSTAYHTIMWEIDVH